VDPDFGLYSILGGSDWGESDFGWIRFWVDPILGGSDFGWIRFWVAQRFSAAMTSTFSKAALAADAK
jgi:hypothetical protein